MLPYSYRLCLLEITLCNGELLPRPDMSCLDSPTDIRKRAADLRPGAVGHLFVISPLLLSTALGRQQSASAPDSLTGGR